MKILFIFLTVISLTNAENLICTPLGVQNTTDGTKIKYTKMERNDMPKLKLNVSNSTIIAKLNGATERFNYTEIKYNSRMYWSKNNMYMRRSLENKDVFFWDIKKYNKSLILFYACK